MSKDAIKPDWKKWGKSILLMADKKSANEIAKISGINVKTIIYFIRKNGKKPIMRHYKRTDWKAIHNDIVEDLKVMCASDVAAKHDINFNTFMSYCQRNNIPRSFKKPREPMLKIDHYDKVRKLYEAGHAPEDIAKTMLTSLRSVNDALNNMYRTAGNAETKGARVLSSEFRRRIGPWLDRCFAQGHIVINSEKRGEAVLMCAANYNMLKYKADAYDKQQKKSK